MKRITVEEKDLIAALLKSGLIGAEVAEKTGRSIASVNKIRKEIQVAGFDIWHNGGVVSSSIK